MLENENQEQIKEPENNSNSKVNTEEETIPTFGIRKVKKGIVNLFNTIKNTIADDFNNPMLTSAEALGVILNAYVNQKPTNQDQVNQLKNEIEILNEQIKQLQEQVNSKTENPFSCNMYPEVAEKARKYRKFIYEKGFIKNPDKSQYPHELANLAIKRFLKFHFE